MNTLKLLRKAIAITALPLLLATATTTQVGCGAAGQTQVAQGKKFESGDPTYDQFFTAVHELQLEMGQAPEKEAKLRLELGKQLGVEPEEDEAPPAEAQPAAAAPKAEANAAGTPSVTDAYGDQLKQSAINSVPGGAQYQAAKAQVESAKQTVNQLKSIFGGGGSDAPAAPAKPATPVKKAPKPPSASLIAKALKKRSEKLGLEMKLEVDRNGISDGEASAELRLAKPDYGSEAKGLAEKVEKTAKAELDLIVRMKKAQKKLEVLEKLSGTLEANVSTTFRTSRAKMSDVSKNLADATQLIKLMTARAQDVDKKAQAMLAKLEDAASADIAKPEDEASKEAVATTTTEPVKDDAQAAEEAKKEEAAEKARAEEAEKLRREDIRKAKKEAAEKEAEAKRLKKELAEKEAEAKRAKREAERKEKAAASSGKSSAAKPASPTKAAMADFEP